MYYYECVISSGIISGYVKSGLRAGISSLIHDFGRLLAYEVRVASIVWPFSTKMEDHRVYEARGYYNVLQIYD